MPQADPYAILGVPRTASRAEIARAYRRLAKQHHPDAGAEPTPQMSRINEAWNTLSDPERRARWDRQYTVAQPAPWAPAPTAEPLRRRPPPEPEAPSSPMETGWGAALVVAGVAVLIGAVLIGLNVAFGQADDRVEFRSDEITFRHDPAWTVYPGDASAESGRRVIAHLATYELDQPDRCTSPRDPCLIAGELMPVGEVSVIFTAWSEGTPPETEPGVSRPFGLDADGLIGGKPAAVEVTQVDNVYVGWWQLSPPDFPDRWIEVRADFRASRQIEVDRAFAAIQEVLDTVEFAS